jgi:uncharacterized protein Yka (UPF0111/DUF47 family)
MDVASIAGTAMLMRYEQTQNNISMAVMKQAVNQMEQVADMLMDNAKEVQAMTRNTGSGFSVYA